jgi:predicted membrane protein (TIGR00267 family)
MLPIRAAWHNLKDYDNLVGIGEIARRYFAMNAFDGVLTMIGVFMGNLAAGVDQPTIVLTTGLTTAIAMGVSGLWGAYLTETAERQRELDDLSHYTLTDLNNTRIGKASRTAVIIVAIVDGLSPLLAALTVLLPFVMVQLWPALTWPIASVYYISLGLALLALFGLGVFLGRISRQNLWLFGLKTVMAGVLSILISYLLRGIEH